MNILVCVKHVVDSTEVRVDRKTSELVLRGIPVKINDYDKNAIEEAVKLKKENNGTVTLLTIGPKDAFKTVKEGLAMGADQAYIVDDSGLTVEDPFQTAGVLAAAIQKLGAFDLMMAGTVSEDRGNSITGPALAELLGLDHIAYVHTLQVDGRTVTAGRRAGELEETIACSMPLVVTVDRSINIPRLPTAIQVMKVPASKIIKWTLEDIGLAAPPASRMSQTGYHAAQTNRKKVLLEGDPAAASEQLLQHLVQEGVL